MNKRTKHMKKYVPYGIYCYEGLHRCPFWNPIHKADEDYFLAYDKVRCDYFNHTFNLEDDGADFLFLADECKICDLHLDEDEKHYKNKRWYWYKKHRWELKQDAKQAFLT